jgi:hypothetical protein
VSAAPSEQISKELRTRGLAAPAAFLLEAHRPLRPLLGLAATAILPLARPLLGARLDAVQRTLDDEAAYDRLVDSLRAAAEG